MTVCFWDCETVARPAAEIEEMMPEDVRNPRIPEDLERPVVPNFEHKGMKDGAAKEEWRAKKVAEFHAEHKAKVAKWLKKAEGRKQSWFNEGALDPLTGTIALIGLHVCEYPKPEGGQQSPLILCAEKIPAKLARKFGVMCFEGEGKMLEAYWHFIKTTRTHSDGFIMAGFHSNRFDLRMAVVRSAVHRVKPSVPVMQGAYPVRDLWIDLHDNYACGKRELYAGINEVAKALNIKPKEKDGGMFADLWANNKEAALTYLRDDDLRLTKEIGEAFLPL